MIERKSPKMILGSLVLAGGIIGLSLLLAYAKRNGILSGDGAERVMGVVFGVMFIVIGNYLPKTLDPISERRCDPSKKQALQRFAGWTFCLAGLIYALAWIVLPVALADIVSTVALATTVVLVMSRLLWVLFSGTAHNPPELKG